MGRTRSPKRVLLGTFLPFALRGPDVREASKSFMVTPRSVAVVTVSFRSFAVTESAWHRAGVRCGQSRPTEGEQGEGIMVIAPHPYSDFVLDQLADRGRRYCLEHGFVEGVDICAS